MQKFLILVLLKINDIKRSLFKAFIYIFNHLFFRLEVWSYCKLHNPKLSKSMEKLDLDRQKYHFLKTCPIWFLAWYGIKNYLNLQWVNSFGHIKTFLKVFKTKDRVECSLKRCGKIFSGFSFHLALGCIQIKREQKSMTKCVGNLQMISATNANQHRWTRVQRRCNWSRNCYA